MASSSRQPSKTAPARADVAARPESLTRERLLASAARLFRRQGYAGTTTRQLASELGIQSASLYYHIGSKEDLLYELSVASLTHIRAQVERELSTHQTGADRLRALICAHVATALTDQDQHATMLVELRSLGPERQATVLTLRDDYEKLVRDVIAQAQREGAVRRDLSPKELGLALLNLLNWTIFWYQPDGALKPERLAETLATVFLHGALDPAAPRDVTNGRASRGRRANNLASAR